MSGILEFAAILFGYGLSPAGAAGVPPLEGGKAGRGGKKKKKKMGEKKHGYMCILFIQSYLLLVFALLTGISGVNEV